MSWIVGGREIVNTPGSCENASLYEESERVSIRFQELFAGAHDIPEIYAVNYGIRGVRQRVFPLPHLNAMLLRELINAFFYV